MPTRAERLKKWEEKQAKAKAEIQRIKALDRAAEKKKDTKQRILLGSWTRKMMKEGTWPATRKEALESMDKFFTRASDRDVLNLSAASGGSLPGNEGEQK